ncbi:hypothetical protein DC522_30145 [Microvirga sp. KLBC 81]|uniref:hypothetical protein n=1 Tax=Microvirga sp. KLBC 81 TaxID=1862707 RepID=UPI000D50AA0B|nr:hypothetical protein [Microvirga sp. KLBC 81]PVE20815.1 hypothetical protein DC522_30145 [Microvirga sp. KLBC 81]
MNIPKQAGLTVLALLAGSAALLWSGGGPIPSGSFISRAEARVGRPATPMSYAGVARRTTRRAVAYGTAAGAAAAAGTYYYAAPGCQQVVNSYGQIVYRCP